MILVLAYHAVPPTERLRNRLSRRQVDVRQLVSSPQDLLRLFSSETDAAEPGPLGRVRAFAQGRPHVHVLPAATTSPGETVCVAILCKTSVGNRISAAPRSAARRRVCTIVCGVELVATGSGSLRVKVYSIVFVLI